VFRAAKVAASRIEPLFGRMHMKIALGADSAGKPLLDVVSAHLNARAGVVVTDLSSAGFYADIADRVASSERR
jgi:hypothetical protein